jgi:hypothetical protein
MQDKRVAYWHKDGLEVFRITDKKAVKYASGTLDKLEPIKGGLGKKILIVSRELLLHARKRYPPATEEKLLKAVALEIGDIFPLSNPAFHCRVFQSFNTYTVVDIWAWDSEQYNRLEEVFPFNYVVPEDLAFASADPEVKVFQHGETTNMLAYADGTFLAGASYPASGFSREDVKRFLHSLDQSGAEIKKIKIYGSLPLTLNDMMEVSRVDGRDYPPCLDEIESLDLSRFKIKGDYYRLWEKKDLIFRIAIYLILGYILMQYLTLRNYDRTADEIRQKMAVMDTKAARLDTGQKVEDYSTVIKEVNEKLNATHSPLKVMNMLARTVPEGSFVNKIVLNENRIEASVSTKDPISLVKALGDAKEIKKVSLKGAPVKDRATHSYNFVIMMELVQ